MAGYPMFIPRAPRKRLLALSELIRLQMKAEKDKFTTAMEVRVRIKISYDNDRFLRAFDSVLLSTLYDAQGQGFDT